MRTHGTGSFKKRSHVRADGTTVTRWRGYVPSPDGAKHYGTGKTQKEAEANARAAMKNKAAKPATIPVEAVPTLAEWLATYNAHRKATRRKDATITAYARHAAHWCAMDPGDGKGPLGPRPLPSLTFDVLELAIARFGDSYAPNTVRNLQAYISGALKRAYLLRITARAEGALLEAIPRKVKGELRLDDDDFGAMLRAADGNTPMIAAMILGRYGLRIGEACGLISDDLTLNVLTLSRQLQRVDTTGYYGPGETPRPKDARAPKGGTTLSLCELKSDAAARRIVLSDVESRILMNAMDDAKLDTVWDSVSREWRTVLFIARAPNGKAQEVQRLRARFVALTKGIGLDVDYHDLRALCATSLADAGHAVKAISGALGHRDVSTTELYIRGLRRSTSAIWTTTQDAVALALAS